MHPHFKVRQVRLNDGPTALVRIPNLASNQSVVREFAAIESDNFLMNQSMRTELEKTVQFGIRDSLLGRLAVDHIKDCAKHLLVVNGRTLILLRQVIFTRSEERRVG